MPLHDSYNVFVWAKQWGLEIDGHKAMRVIRVRFVYRLAQQCSSVQSIYAVHIVHRFFCGVRRKY